MKHRLIFFGSGDFGLPLLEVLRANSSIDLIAVISQPPRPTGRTQQSVSTPVSDWAKSNKFDVLSWPTLRSDEVIAVIRGLSADTFIVADYGLILPASVLQLPSNAALNIHASLLPKHRGATPIAAAIMAGDSTTGVSFMKMDAGIDTGPVLAQYPCEIEVQDTAVTLRHRLADLAATHLDAVLAGWWQGDIKPQIQDDAKSTYAPRLKKIDGQIDWQSAIKIERQIRAYNPWPGVWSTWNNHIIKFIAGQVGPSDKLSPGTIIARSQSPGWAVACQTGIFIPHRVQFEGKKPQLAAHIPGSYPNFIGSKFTVVTDVSSP